MRGTSRIAVGPDRRGHSEPQRVERFTHSNDEQVHGNRTGAVDQSGVHTTYTWDQASELTGYQGPDHTNPGQTVSDTFVYDAIEPRGAT